MELAALIQRAVELRSRYAAVATAAGGEPWTRAEWAQGWVGDVGELGALVLAKEGRREGPAHLDAKLEHEWADDLCSVLVLVDAIDVNSEGAFGLTMDALKRKLVVPGAGSGGPHEKQILLNP